MLTERTLSIGKDTEIETILEHNPEFDPDPQTLQICHRIIENGFKINIIEHKIKSFLFYENNEEIKPDSYAGMGT